MAAAAERTASGEDVESLITLYSHNCGRKIPFFILFLIDSHKDSCTSTHTHFEAIGGAPSAAAHGAEGQLEVGRWVDRYIDIR